MCIVPITHCPAYEDTFEAYFALAKVISDSVEAERIVVRPHPRHRDKQRFEELAKQFGFLFSDASVETFSKFVSNVERIVCGNSYVITEAKIANRLVAVYAPLPQSEDHLGLLQARLQDVVCSSALSVLQFISCDARAIQRSHRLTFDFMETIGTKWLGQSAKLIAETLIQHAFSNHEAVSSNWVLLDGNSPKDRNVFVPRSDRTQ